MQEIVRNKVSHVSGCIEGKGKKKFASLRIDIYVKDPVRLILVFHCWVYVVYYSLFSTLYDSELESTVPVLFNVLRSTRTRKEK